MASYFLFEPIFQYPFGWENVPSKENEKVYVAHNELTSQEYDRKLENTFKELDNPSLSIAIGQGSELVWNNAIGYADIVKNQKATPLNQYRIGSTSKAVTSVGLGLLIDEGKISLKDTVGTFLPSLNANLRMISVGQLASHTSGIKNYGVCLCLPIWETLNNDSYNSVEKALSIFKGDALLFDSGTDFGYSSYNYTLLSAVMEKAGGMEFTSFMQKQVFDKLQMNSTQAETSGMSQEYLATFYDLEDGSYKGSFPVDNSNKWAGGGFVSTPSDLVRLASALQTSDVISQETKEELWTPVALSNPLIKEENYAYGWRSAVTSKINGNPIHIIHHAGTANGSSSVLIVLPDYQLSISLLTNKTNNVSELFDIAYEYAREVIDDK